MADQLAVTHESYDGPACKFCGAVLTCLSCRGGVDDPEQELREIAKEMREECSPVCSCKCTLDGPESSPDSVYRAKHDSTCEVWRFLRRAYNLGLATIHRDGGHYAAEHGIEKAEKDAERIVLADRAELAKIRAQCGEENKP